MATRIKVWDLAVRVFHWSLVLLFVTAYLSGEEERSWHVYVGYAIAALVLFRVVWGFVGGRYARFKAFLYSPAETLAYIRDSWHGRSRHYLSHNPLGALMVFALLLSLSGTVVSGLMLNGDLAAPQLAAVSDEPLYGAMNAEHDDDVHDDEEHDNAQHEWLEDLHELGANLTLLLIVLHVLGVAMASRFHKEKLVPAMITGWKDQQPRS